MRFIVELPDVDYISEDEYWRDRQDELLLRDVTLQLIRAFPDVKVMIDDRPDWMDFVKEITTEPGHDGPRTVYVWFTNGHSCCSCHSQFSYNSTTPSLRT